MSNTTVDPSLSAYIASLHAVSRQITLYVAPIQIIVGTIANILNILIFTSKNLRTNPCSFYFLSSSIADLPVIYVDMLTQLLTQCFNIPTDTSSNFVCKFKFYIVETFRALSASYITLASFDRYASTSNDVRRRRWSTIHRAHLLVLFVTIFLCVSYFHVPLYFNVKTLPTGGLSCIGEVYASGYRLFSDLYFTITYCLIPPSLMLLFGCLTIRNVRLSKRQLAAGNTRMSTTLHRKDNQLIRMLLFQVLSFIPLTLPVGIRKLYALFTAGYTKSALTLATDDFAQKFLTLESIVYHSWNFFLYTLASSFFRKELKSILKCHNGQIHNVTTISSQNPNVRQTQRFDKNINMNTIEMTKKNLCS